MRTSDIFKSILGQSSSANNTSPSSLTCLITHLTSFIFITLAASTFTLPRARIAIERDLDSNARNNGECGTIIDPVDSLLHNERSYSSPYIRSPHGAEASSSTQKSFIDHVLRLAATEGPNLTNDLQFNHDPIPPIRTADHLQIAQIITR